MKFIIFGEPTEYECTEPLEVVGEDWDGVFKPIDQLTYGDRPPDDEGPER